MTFLGRCHHCLDNAYIDATCLQERNHDCLIRLAKEHAMPSRMVPAQQLSDAGEDLERLAAAKDAEIAALTEQRDRAMKVVEGARKWRASLEGDGWDEDMMEAMGRPGLMDIIHALAALDAEAAAETAPSLPETP